MTSPTSRPTLDLALIAKNEIKNIERLFKSVNGCFDNIHLTDTGSNDGTVEWAKEHGEKVAGCPVHIHHFDWVNSFAKARNYSFSHSTSDFVMWLDLDDCISDRLEFIKWRNNAMEFSDFWLATYNYALDANGKPLISFVRERIFNRAKTKPTWQYDIHEGILIQPTWRPGYAVTWTVNHMRDLEDIKADKSRNLAIIEAIHPKDARMTFYYGKELYEAQRPFEAIKYFEQAIKMPELQPHDKILSYQYGAASCSSCFDQLKDELKDEKTKYFERAIEFCTQGIKLDPNRAEFHVAAGDLYIKRGDLMRAIPYFAAAKSCYSQKDQGSPYEGAVYSFLNCYGELPSLQLAKIYAHTGQLEKSKKECLDCIANYDNAEAKVVLIEVQKATALCDIDGASEQTEDIVFTCPPQQAYPFDEEIYKTKGLGGSETALVHMAKNLKKKTGRAVKIFHNRETDMVGESGVEWLSNKTLNKYMSTKKPHTHIAWRHNIKITNAPTYLWCHDLTTQGVESRQSFDKIMCLTEFHRDYVSAMQGVKDDKIIVTRNGIDPKKFEFERKSKNPNKVVWMSSPDRGLDRCIGVMDRLREEFKELELHVYYGLENLYKYGLGDLAKKLEQMMTERPWIKYHGFTEQNKMYREVSDAVMWLHTCDFIETSCITANEMLALGVYPVTRKLGGLKNTLADAESKGHAVMLPHDCLTELEIKSYVDAAADVLRNKKWQGITFDIDAHDWQKVSDEWIDFMKIPKLEGINDRHTAQ